MNGMTPGNDPVRQLPDASRWTVAKVSMHEARTSQSLDVG